MLTFILTFTFIGLIAGAACGRLSYEGRSVSDCHTQTALCAFMGAAGGLVLTTLLASAMLNMGASL